MKHKASVFAVGMLAALCAHAQSSVTIYGLISLGVVHTDNVGGGSQNRLVAGPFQLSRIGFKGTEDLGGGNSVFFVLENGFNPDTGGLGQGGRFFGRAAVLGFNSNAYGSIWLGRQNDVATDAMCIYESACTFGGFGTHVGDNDNLFTTFRINNGVTYKSPNWAGVQVAAQYGLSEAKTARDNREYSASAKYEQGDLSLGAAVMNVDKPNSATNQAGAVVGDYGFSSPFSTSRFSGSAVSQQRAEDIGASYKILGDGVITALYTKSRFLYLDNSKVNISNSEVGFSKYITPSMRAGIGYFITKADYDENLSSRSWRELNLGVNYFLSKRTDISAVYIHQNAYGAGNAAYIYSEGKASGTSQNSYGIGLRHRF